MPLLWVTWLTQHHVREPPTLVTHVPTTTPEPVDGPPMLTLRITFPQCLFLSLSMFLVAWTLIIPQIPFSLSCAISQSPDQNEGNVLSGDMKAVNEPLLGIASHIYLVSLPQRVDRRRQMEALRTNNNLGLVWTVVDALSPADPVVLRIFDWVLFQRSQFTHDSSSETPQLSDFRWPSEINAMSLLRGPFPAAGSELWPTISPPNSSYNLSSIQALTCATEDSTLPNYSVDSPDWRILSAPKIACWHSHVSAIQRFVVRNDTFLDDVAIVLEDDINMEKDIVDRLTGLHPLLPVGWDILFLGTSDLPACLILYHVIFSLISSRTLLVERILLPCSNKPSNE